MLPSASINGHDPHVDLYDVRERLLQQQASRINELLPQRLTREGDGERYSTPVVQPRELQ